MTLLIILLFLINFILFSMIVYNVTVTVIDTTTHNGTGAAVDAVGDQIKIQTRLMRW